MNTGRLLTSERGRPFAATAVIVLYRMAPNESASVRTLLEARRNLPRQGSRLHVIIWDNSPNAQNEASLPGDTVYIHDARNIGLAKAYNRALEFAIEHQSEWLITLDQDTTLPPNYLDRMSAAAQKMQPWSGVGAVVPRIEANGEIVSPNRFIAGAIPCWYQSGECGVPDEEVYAFNSGSMLRVDALQQAGGYSPWFWFDNSDSQLFKKLHQHGKRVYVAGDIRVEHEFSMKDIRRLMTPERYEQALLAESAFWDLNMNWLARSERTMRLILRLTKQWVRQDPVALRRITRNAAMARLFSGRAKRIKKWREFNKERLGDALMSSSLSPRRMKISVCMAAYNGERYIGDQLRSILKQLNVRDEVVIVDDCSQDRTVMRIAELADPRVRLLRHTANCGVMATFEDALRSATGDIVFLCDDDDIWAEAKVERFLKAFEEYPDAQIVSSRVQLIDESGTEFLDSRFDRGGRFAQSFWRNLFRNHYQGSAMAIRASLLGDVLPFPSGRSFMHDAWIGTRNALIGGRAVFIEEDLLLYRRHSHNATRPKTLLKKIQVRLDLLIAHVSYAFHVTT